MSSGAGNDDDWTPPSESRLKLLAAKRERSDKISKLMGDYLLKGHKMLATLCPRCDAIQMEDRQGKVYCVACNEVDADENAKDDPVLQQQRQQQEQQVNQEFRVGAYARHQVPQAAAASCQPSPAAGSPQLEAELQMCIKALTAKMASARDRLERTPNDDLPANKVLVAFLTECANCAAAIKRAGAGGGADF